MSDKRKSTFINNTKNVEISRGAVGSMAHPSDTAPTTPTTTTHDLQTLGPQHVGQVVSIDAIQLGTLRFFGTTHFKEGIWCGIQCHTPVGKNNGSVQGKRYFTCPDKYGIFAPLAKVCLVRQGSPRMNRDTPTKIPPPCVPTKITTNHLKDPHSTKGRKGGTPSAPITKEPMEGTTSTPSTASTKQTCEGVRTDLRTKERRSLCELSKERSPSPVPPTAATKEKRETEVTSAPTTKDRKEGSSPRVPPTKDTHQGTQSPLLKTRGSGEESPENVSRVSRGSAASAGTKVQGSDGREEPQVLSTPKRRTGTKSGNEGEEENDPGWRGPLSPPDSDDPEIVGEKTEKSGKRGEGKRGQTVTYFKGLDQKRRKLEPGRMSWSASSALKCPNPFRLPNFSQLNLRDEIEGSRVQGLVLTPPSFKSPFDRRGGFYASTPRVNREEEGPPGSSGVALLGQCGGHGLEVQELNLTYTLKKVKKEEEALKRPDSLPLSQPPPLAEWEESSEVGLFGVSTPEFINSLALSVPPSPPSCCTSPGEEDALDNESSLGLLTPSQLQDYWNSMGAEEDLYQHLRSPSVDDLEEDLAEKKEVEDNKSPRQDPPPSRAEDKCSDNCDKSEDPTDPRVSGYCGSEGMTDSDLNAESDQDNYGGGESCGKNRNARVIDGALYTSQRVGSGAPSDPSKGMEIMSSVITASASSASEMESSGFYSDGSERNPSGGSDSGSIPPPRPLRPFYKGGAEVGQGPISSPSLQSGVEEEEEQGFNRTLNETIKEEGSPVEGGAEVIRPDQDKWTREGEGTGGDMCRSQSVSCIPTLPPHREEKRREEGGKEEGAKSATGVQKGRGGRRASGSVPPPRPGPSSLLSGTVASNSRRSSRGLQPALGVRGDEGGSTRSLAASTDPPKAKKVNKWDAVMCQINETKHKQINVRDVKSKVFSSLKGAVKTGVAAHPFSSRSSTFSDSSVDEQQQERHPPSSKHRPKKEEVKGKKGDLPSEPPRTHHIPDLRKASAAKPPKDPLCKLNGDDRRKKIAPPRVMPVGGGTGKSNPRKTTTAAPIIRGAKGHLKEGDGVVGEWSVLKEKVRRAEVLEEKVALALVIQYVEREREYGEARNVAERRKREEELECMRGEVSRLGGELSVARECGREEVVELIKAHHLNLVHEKNKIEAEELRKGEEALEDLRRSFQDQLEEVKKVHRAELEELNGRHKQLLSEHRKQNPHDLLLKEVASLQVVVEMRNAEIRECRKEVIEFKSTVDELERCREGMRTLEAKVEDLQAQVVKGRGERRKVAERGRVDQETIYNLESQNRELTRAIDELKWHIQTTSQPQSS